MIIRRCLQKLLEILAFVKKNDLKWNLDMNQKLQSSRTFQFPPVCKFWNWMVQHISDKKKKSSPKAPFLCRQNQINFKQKRLDAYIKEVSNCNIILLQLDFQERNPNINFTQRYSEKSRKKHGSCLNQKGKARSELSHCAVRVSDGDDSSLHFYLMVVDSHQDPSSLHSPQFVQYPYLMAEKSLNQKIPVLWL